MLSCLCTCLYERCSGLILAPFDDVQPSAVGNNAFKCAVAMFVCRTHLCRKVFDDLVEVAIVENKLLHQCFKAQHLDRTAMQRVHVLEQHNGMPMVVHDGDSGQDKHSYSFKQEKNNNGMGERT